MWSFNPNLSVNFYFASFRLIKAASLLHWTYSLYLDNFVRMGKYWKTYCRYWPKNMLNGHWWYLSNVADSGSQSNLSCCKTVWGYWCSSRSSAQWSQPNTYRIPRNPLRKQKIMPVKNKKNSMYRRVFTVEDSFNKRVIWQASELVPRVQRGRIPASVMVWWVH